MTDEEKPLLCVRSHSREPESDVSIGDVPTWRSKPAMSNNWHSKPWPIVAVLRTLTVLPGCHQATATVDTPLEMVTGSLSVAPRKKCDPEPDMPEPVTPTVPSSLAEDLPPTTRRSSSFADRPGVLSYTMLCHWGNYTFYYACSVVGRWHPGKPIHFSCEKVRHVSHTLPKCKDIVSGNYTVLVYSTAIMWGYISSISSITWCVFYIARSKATSAWFSVSWAWPTQSFIIAKCFEVKGLVTCDTDHEWF